MIPDRERTTGSLFERMEASSARNRQGGSIHSLRQSIRSGNPFARTYETFLIPGPVVAGVRLSWALMNRKGLKTSANP